MCLLCDASDKNDIFSKKQQNKKINVLNRL